MIVVPAEFAQQYAEREGKAGRAWIDSLPTLIDELAQRWGLDVGDRIVTAHVGLVCFVERAGQPLVLKVSFPYDESLQEGDVLAAWDGDGGVRLIEQAHDQQALLMERAGEESLIDVPLDEAIGVIAGLWSRLQAHEPPPGLMSTDDAARRWTAALDPEWAFLADGLQTDEQVLLHGDLHYENVLRGEREPWLAIDPKCFVGDPCFEAVAPLWNRLDELIGDRDAGIRARHRQICDAAGLEVIRAAKWSILHALEDGDGNEIVPALSELL